MLSAGSVFLLSTSLFIIFAVIARGEALQGRRFFLAHVRNKADEAGERFYDWLTLLWRRLARHTIQLSWYYGIHSTLRAILTVLVKTYDRLELIFMRNRERAKRLRAERRADRQSHLTIIGEHKAATALSPAEKKKLKAKKLRGE